VTYSSYQAVNGTVLHRLRPGASGDDL